MAKRKESAYSQKLKDPRWVELRQEVLERAGRCCEGCGEKEGGLQVHHSYYEWGKEPWEYSPQSLQALCEPCHAVADAAREDIKQRAAMLRPHGQLLLAELLESLAAMSGMRAESLINKVCDLALEELRSDTDETYRPMMWIQEFHP